MQVLLDHLGAILVSSVLLVLFGAVQLRGQQASVDAQRDYAIKSKTYAFAQVLERDLENMRSRKQVEDARLTTQPTLGAYACKLERDAAGRTTTFTFPTSDVAGTSIVQVTYTLEDAAKSTVAKGEAQALYRLDRWVDGARDGSSGDIVAAFAVELIGRGGLVTPNGDCPADLRQVRTQLMAAHEGVAPTDRSSGSSFNTTRYGATVHPPNLTVE